MIKFFEEIIKENRKYLLFYNIIFIIWIFCFEIIISLIIYCYFKIINYSIISELHFVLFSKKKKTFYYKILYQNTKITIY